MTIFSLENRERKCYMTQEILFIINLASFSGNVFNYLGDMSLYRTLLRKTANITNADRKLSIMHEIERIPITEY